ncbi:MAG: hypothetical protein ACOYYS_27505 [Chloroflexota bacterium]
MPRNKSSASEAELEQLELLLRATLMPKLPRSSYSMDLQRRLSNRSAPTLEFPRHDDSLVWLFLAVISMTIILWVFRKLILSGMLDGVCRKKRVGR